MVDCSYCNEPVVMPYKCSLCAEKYCGKHRLPEFHECINIGVYQTDEYKKIKLEKQKEVKMAHVSYYDDSQPVYTNQQGMMGNVWVATDNPRLILYLGLIIGLIAASEVNALFLFANYISLLPIFLISGILSVGIIQLVRTNFEKQYGVESPFIFWKMGVLITIFASLLGFRFYLAGFFQTSGSGKQQAYMIAANSMVIALYKIVIRSIIIYFNPQLVIFPALYSVSNALLWLGIFTMLPFGTFDGIKLYHYNKWLYIAIMALLVLLIFL